MPKEPTSREILEAIHAFAESVDERFNKIDERLDKTDERLDNLDGRVNKIGSQMVTKDYLDDKLVDLRGDLVVMLRKEDTKMSRLVEILMKKSLISEEETKAILSMEPFAKLYV